MSSTLCISRFVFLRSTSNSAPSNRAAQACARSYRLAGLAMLTSVPQSQTVNASSSSSPSPASSSSTLELSPSSNHERSQLDDPAQPGLSEFVARVKKERAEIDEIAAKGTGKAEEGRRGRGGEGGDEGERKLRRGPGAKEKERHKVKVCDKACANCKKKQQPTSW